ncbi:hypothetical protein [Streptomyces luteocolor]|uniref:hypothetical protein n=1 Tax=Streptomyces luteocolor TaxID=285500 RepID=UPI000852EA52|nr:hypothetical protein [Streptomyces luteocolor]
MTHAHDTCDTFEPGHQVHWIQARNSAADPGTVTDVLLSSHDVGDDGRITLHVLGPTRGVPAALWTHDPLRLRRLLRDHRGPVQWQPRWNLLRLRRDAAVTTLVCVAPHAPGR